MPDSVPGIDSSPHSGTKVFDSVHRSETVELNMTFSTPYRVRYEEASAASACQLSQTTAGTSAATAASTTTRTEGREVLLSTASRTTPTAQQTARTTTCHQESLQT
jgi:hypothetical protein